MHLSYKGKMLGKLTSKKLMQWMKMVVIRMMMIRQTKGELSSNKWVPRNLINGSASLIKNTYLLQDKPKKGDALKKGQRQIRQGAVW